MEFLTHVLPNGLEIVAECNPEAYSTALGFIVKTGARDESDEIAGVSHFLEHMAFKGTPTRSADDVNREFDEMGSHYNAGTSEETTVYLRPRAAGVSDPGDGAAGRHPPPFAPRGRLPHREEGDPGRDPDVRGPAAVRGRRQVPGGLLRRSPLGPQRAGHDGQHRGPAGRGDARLLPPPLCPGQHRPGGGRPRRFRAPGRRLPTGLRRLGTGRVPADRRAGRSRGAGSSGSRKASATQQYLLQMSLGPAADDDDRYAAKLLAIVLGDDSGSRLYWELVDPGIAEVAELSHGEYQGAGVFFTQISCAPEDADEVYERAMQVYETAHAEGITEAELQQAKNKVRSQLVLSSERPSRRMFGVGGDWVYRREYRSLEEDLDLVASIRLDQIADVLQRYSLVEGTALTIGPE